MFTDRPVPPMRDKQEGWLVAFSKLAVQSNCQEFGQKGRTNLIDPVSFHSRSADTCSRLLALLHMQIGTFVEENQK